METNNTRRFGHVRELPKDAEESRIIPFVISDESKDRHGTIIPIKGWELDAFNRNGIVGYQHNVYGAGMCEGPNPDDVIGKGRSFIDGMELIGEVEFEPAAINPTAEKIFRKVLFGSLTSTSVGFNPIEDGVYGEGEEARGAENETYYFGKRELLEFSVVNIPSNRNAQKRAMRDQAASAINYVYRELGGKFRLSQIEEMRVADVLTLLEGKDLEIRSTDPQKVAEMLQQIEQKQLHIAQLERKIKFLELK